jgi:tyrosyl-tRNA synthetase
MGKTEGNMVALSDTPEEMYGKVMSWNDGLIIPGFELCTNVSMQELEIIARELVDGSMNPRDLKMKLAYELTSLYHDKEKAKKAENHFIEAFQNREIPKDVLEITVEKNIPLIDVLVKNNLVSSKTEFRRLVEDHAIMHLDTNEKVSNTQIIAVSGVYRIGKKRFCKIILK